MSTEPKSKQNLGALKLSKRKPPPPVALDDDPATASLIYGDEKQYRVELFKHFNNFVRENGAFIVSPPTDPRVRIQIPDGSPFPEKLAAFPRYAKAVVKLANVSHRLMHGTFTNAQEVELKLWR